MSRKTARNIDHNPDPARKQRCLTNRAPRMNKARKLADPDTGKVPFFNRHTARAFWASK
jgi:hypothetical protein